MPTGGHREHSDLPLGRFSTAVVEKLFTASRYLFAVKPWTFVKAHQVLRMDIPTLGIDGACLSIIGQLGESRGVLIFPSLDGFERFLAAANAGRREHGAITMGTELLSLTFQHATELPPSMYREAMRNALPVESPNSYPLVAHRNPKGAALLRRRFFRLFIGVFARGRSLFGSFCGGDSAPDSAHPPLSGGQPGLITAPGRFGRPLRPLDIRAAFWYGALGREMPLRWP